MNDIEEKFFRNGKLERIPKKNVNKIKLFKYIITNFEPNKFYSEKDVNNIIKEIYDDYAIIRRYLVDYKYLERDAGGYSYSINMVKYNEQ